MFASYLFQMDGLQYKGTIFKSFVIYTTKGALCAQKLENGISCKNFSTLSYSDIALIDNFDLNLFYFYFVFEFFGNNSVSTP